MASTMRASSSRHGRCQRLADENEWIARGLCMRDVVDAIGEWYRSGDTFALGTVVRTFRSAPHGPGSRDGRPRHG